MQQFTREQRWERSALKAKLLREFSDRQFTKTDLLVILGEAFKAKFREAPTRHQIPGKHAGGHHARIQMTHVDGMPDEDFPCRGHHPAGTKLLRRFIRQSGRESTANRRAYTKLTGHQYTGRSA
jgi:hypothetical protein